MKIEVADVNSFYKTYVPIDFGAAIPKETKAPMPKSGVYVSNKPTREQLEWLNRQPDEIKPFLADFDFEHDNIVWTDWNPDVDGSVCAPKDPSKLRCRIETYSSRGELASARIVYPFVTDKVDMLRMKSDEKYRDEMNARCWKVQEEYEDSLSTKESSELDFLEQRLVDSMVDLHFKKRHWDAHVRECAKEKYQHDLCAYLECYVESRYKSQNPLDRVKTSRMPTGAERS